MIQIILTSICATIYFIDINRLHLKWNLNYKPFSCSSCLPFWVAAVLYFTPQLIVDILTLAFVSGVLGTIASYLLNKLYYGAES
jgi:hypothetical protein